MVLMLVIEELDSPGSVVGCRHRRGGRGLTTYGQPSLHFLPHWLVFPWWKVSRHDGLSFDSAMLRPGARPMGRAPVAVATPGVTGLWTGYPEVCLGLLSTHCSCQQFVSK